MDMDTQLCYKIDILGRVSIMMPKYGMDTVRTHNGYPGMWILSMKNETWILSKNKNKKIKKKLKYQIQYNTMCYVF